MPNYRNNPNYCRATSSQSPKYKHTINQYQPDSNKEELLMGCSLAMAYVPIQQWEKPYEIEKGLQVGTIFPELDKPFLGKGGCR